jgi:hypothetical protein
LQGGKLRQQVFSTFSSPCFGVKTVYKPSAKRKTEDMTQCETALKLLSTHPWGNEIYPGDISLEYRESTFASQQNSLLNRFSTMLEN